MGAWNVKATALIDAIKATGVPATMDPRRVNPPCALIVPPDFERTTAGCGPWSAWTIHLVAPGVNDLDAATWLLDHIVDVFEAVGAFSAEYGNLTIDPASDPLPAYTITVINGPM